MATLPDETPTALCRAGRRPAVSATKTRRRQLSLVAGAAPGIGSIEHRGTPLHRKTVTRADLVEALSREVDLKASVCAGLLEDVLALVAERLTVGEPVGIVNFGSFTVRRKGARMGRNPKTGEAVPIAPRRVVVFRPARKFRHYTNHPEDLPRRARRQLELF